MSNEINSGYFLGLDIGTDSIGYAVTDTVYTLKKRKGMPMWGVHLFDEAKLCAERRAFRTARRRLDRRQQRIRLVQEIFAEEIFKTDPNFYTRINSSHLFPEDSECGVSIFNDPNYKDKDYFKAYPTIHHLICALMEQEKPHDVRLVYLACAWLAAHRGHFLKELSIKNLEELTDIGVIYKVFMDFFDEEKPWSPVDPVAFGEILKKKMGKQAKYRELCQLLYQKPKATKESFEAFPYNREGIVKLLCGSTFSISELFYNEAYSELKSFSLDADDESFGAILSELGDDGELLMQLKSIYDWAVLCDVLKGYTYISQAKVADYETHAKDLKLLKRLVRTYLPEKYNEVFRATGKNNYAAYSGNFKSATHRNTKRVSLGDFSKYILKLFESVVPQEADAEILAEMKDRLELGTFMPKQVNPDNRVIPYQVYYAELQRILQKAAAYLPFLKAKDADGYTAQDKLLSVFQFRVPYFVGPIDTSSDRAWMRRRAEGPIYPWNFEEKVDIDASEQAFIARMTNSCTYLPGEDSLPKMSLCYEKFQVLNEINVVSINGHRLPVEVKQAIYNELFLTNKRVTPKRVREFLLAHNYYTKEELMTFSGLDETVKSSLATHIAFGRLLHSGRLTQADAEAIIKRAAYCEDRGRLVIWLKNQYPALSEDDRKYISHLKLKGFGRLSWTFLQEILCVEKDTGEVGNILEWMWNRNLNLMELLSDRFSFAEQIEALHKEYYLGESLTLSERLDKMYISNAVKRPIIRTMDLVDDIVKAIGKPPKRIFIEMARGGKPEERGKRTLSRYRQLCELYAKIDTEDVRSLQAELEAMGEQRDNQLQSERLFLYFMQLGKCMYSGESITLSSLSDKTYDIDHIYPQSKVKDDSVLNNKVLVKSEKNAEKSDAYPVPRSIRRNMKATWEMLRKHSLITEEKYRRLIRNTPFDENEEWGFINRQLVETRQSTKAVATLLKEKYPDTEIVFVKAGIVSEFRQEFDMLKSRAVNDLHHAKDAYLSIAAGNVYHERFTKQWYLENRERYSVNIRSLFTRTVNVGGNTVWSGQASLAAVRNTVQNKNAVNLTRYAYCKTGGFFDQQPVKAAPGLIERKQGLPTEKYGGYNKPTAAFYILAKFMVKKKYELMLVPVELLHSRQFLADRGFAMRYIEKQAEDILGKPINELELPLGMRILKVNTMFELDGYRATLAGKSSGGRVIILSTVSPLVVGYAWEVYIKRLERFAEKKKLNPNLIYSEKYDRISGGQNLELYDILCEKLKTTLYSKRPANPIKTLERGRNTFAGLGIPEQVFCLLNMLSLFSRLSGGCDLSSIGGAKNAGSTTLSASLSNWKKNYSAAYIIDLSPSGLFERRSVNLLELI
ncbi:MAG: type II CRISPR RNA-guided endonuclease Cas9 [Clostridia bacterium]|nr:type II CRISPR RNA-guided endonuclease Cas9 [Clostridia bacterium]